MNPTHTCLIMTLLCACALIWSTSAPPAELPTTPAHNTQHIVSGPTQPTSSTQNDGNQPFWPMRSDILPRQNATFHAVHDLDNNGTPDILTGSFDRYTVALNSGSLHFKSTHYTLPKTTRLFTPTLTDLNADSYPDAISCSDTSVHILLNARDGQLHHSQSFHPSPTFHQKPNTFRGIGEPSGIICASMHIQDLNNDGHRDIQFLTPDPSNTFPSLHWTLTNQGDGTFTSSFSAALNSLKDSTHYRSDLDQNQLDDLIEFRATSITTTLRSTHPNANRHNSDPFPQPTHTPHLKFLDTNQDNLPDLLTFEPKPKTTPPSPHIRIYHGHGDGTFSALHRTLTKPDNLPISDIISADLNLDGFNELIATSSKSIYIWDGNPTTRFNTKPTIIHPHPQPTQSAQISAADFDLDGDLDLFISHAHPTQRHIKRGHRRHHKSAFRNPTQAPPHLPPRTHQTLYTNPTRSPSKHNHLPYLYNSGSVISASCIPRTPQPKPIHTSGDFNGDGHIDGYRMFFHPSSPTTTPIHLLSIGTDQRRNKTKHLSSFPYTTQAALGINLNNDRYDDLLIIDPNGIHTCYGATNPLTSCDPLTHTHRPKHSAPSIDSPDVLALLKADLDKNGLDDIILVTPNKGYTVFLQRPNSPIPHEHIHHTGRFYQHTHTTHDFLANTPRQGSIHTITAAKVADLNHDTHLDLILTSDHQDAVYLGQPNGLFSSTPLLFGHTHTQDLIVHDFNNDTHPDILTVHNANFGHFLWLGNGDGTFHTTHHIPASNAQTISLSKAQDTTSYNVTIQFLDNSFSTWINTPPPK